MISNVTHVTIYVADQEKAKDFYLNVLGFKLHTDTDFGTMRWLTVSPPDNPHFEIYLAKAQENRLQDQEPVACFSTSDCKRAYAELKKKGVEFLSEPSQEEWGIGVVMKDPFGNMFYLNQSR